MGDIWDWAIMGRLMKRGSMRRGGTIELKRCSGDL